MNLIAEIKNFYEYCYNFYNNKNGVYPIATKKEIIEAVNTYITQANKPWNLEFDSMDREQVRVIIGK